MAIRNLLFDLGVVLVHLDYERAAERLMPRCSKLRDGSIGGVLRAFYGDEQLDRYESGHVSRSDFIAHFTAKTGFEGTEEDFVDIWRTIHRLNDPMVEFARELSARHDIYYFSNTGEMHVPWLYEKFPALAFHKGDALSWQLNAMKPARDYYERGLARLKLDPAECLFIDDRPENIRGAAACGLDGVLYTLPEPTIREVRAKLAAAPQGRHP